MIKIAIIDNWSKKELEALVLSSTSMKELERKIGYGKNGYNGAIIKKRCEEEGISLDHFTGKAEQKQKRNESNIFIKDSTASQSTLRRWYFKGNYSEYKCSICGQIPFWNNKELTLILDHINGINNDDRLENLRWVCPNCNQQLDTTGFKKMRVQEIKEKQYYCSNCGKNITASSTTGLCLECANKCYRTCERPPRSELKELIRTTPFTQIARMYKVTDNAIRKWCEKENLPSKVSDIKKYSDLEWEIL